MPNAKKRINADGLGFNVLVVRSFEMEPIISSLEIKMLQALVAQLFR